MAASASCMRASSRCASFPLSQANRRESVYVLEVSGAEPEVRRLASMGVSAGTFLLITSRFEGGVTLVVNGSFRLAVDGRMAEQILVNAVA